MDIIYDNIELFENIGFLTIIFYGIYLFLAIIEFFFEIYTKKFTFNYIKEVSANISVLIPYIITEIMTGTLFFVVFLYIENFIPWSIANNWMSFVLCVIIIDFLYYWEHRFEHRVRLFWGYHSVHHSSTIFNYSTAFRVSFVENITSLLFFIPALLIGFDTYMVLASVIFMLTYQSWLHNHTIPSLGIFERVFNTASLHRVHHGNNDIYIDKNFGAILSIWDQIFSTYQKELFTPTYGLKKQINTINPVKVNLHEFMAIFHDIKNAKNFSHIGGYLFAKPNWKPVDACLCRYSLEKNKKLNRIISAKN